MNKKMSLKWAIPVMALGTQLMGSGCNETTTTKTTTTDSTTVATVEGYDANFKVAAQSFEDLQLLRYEVPGFNGLSLKQKQLAYYLYEAALCGRDIIYDQKSKYGLTLRKTIEAMYATY